MATRFRTFASVSSSPTRLVPRPPGTKYKTILSVDGGGIRGIIPTMVLQRLENNIKEHIFENKDTLIPEDFPHTVKSIDDFDVDLTDYFDLVAGTSIGSWLAIYVAGRGAGADAIYEDANLRRRYPKMRRGGMETPRAVFHEMGRDVFPRRNVFNKAASIFRPLYPSNGVKNVLRKMFSNMTMQDLETGCLITAYDQERHAATSFMKGPRDGGTFYTVRAVSRERPRKATEKARWRPDLNIQQGTNYYLSDIAAASSAAPTFFAPHTMTRSDSQSGERMTLVDGGMVSNNPSLQALTFAPEAFDCNVNKIAMFSVGCGTSDPNSGTRRSPGVGWWLASGNLVDTLMNGTSEYIQSVIDYWMYGTMRLKYGQYLRIQKSADANTKIAEILSTMDSVQHLKTLEEIGTELADTNNEDIKKFVRDYIFAT